MKHDIDILEPIHNAGHPSDYRWDRDRNAKLLNIVYHGSTFGNFLKFMLDKFSKRTPEIHSTPFNKSGTSHGMTDNDFSGMMQKYHQSFIKDNEGQTDLPVCVIMPKTDKHDHYLKKANTFRSGDGRISPDDLWKQAYGEMPDLLRERIDSVRELYQIEETAHFSWTPKFIIRDWYKLDFLQPLEHTYDHQWFQQFSEHQFFKGQQTFYLDLETFFKWDSFVENITRLDQVFGLELDFDRLSEMKTLFDQSMSLDEIRQYCNTVEGVLQDFEHHTFKDLDVSAEAFIYAMFEKRYPDIQMPLTNRFFRDSEEIRQFIEHFPNWYRRSNPNLG